MWSLLGSLISNFLLLRDLFGYVIPGAVLLAFVNYTERPDLLKIPLINESIWIKAAVAITASYLIGQILAAIGYTLYKVKPVSAVLKWLAGYAGQEAPTDERSDADKLFYRYIYPSMFIEADRRETITILRVALSLALLFSASLTELTTFWRVALALTGTFMFLNGYMSQDSTKNYRNSSVDAGEQAAKADVPFFRWGPGGADGDS
jgi:hypothetical protein